MNGHVTQTWILLLTALAAVDCASGRPDPRALPQDTAACKELGRIEPILQGAVQATRVLARDLWPEWRPAIVPVVFTHEDSSRWLFYQGTPPMDALARCTGRSGPVFLLASVQQHVPFHAAASHKGSQVFLRIASPAWVTFSHADWAAILAHEYFHCYQLSHTGWMDRFRLAAEGSPLMKQLADLYRAEPWFAQDIDRQLTLVRDLASRPSLVPADFQALLKLRSAHHERLHHFNAQLLQVELAAELVEGSARFVEYGLYGSPAAIAALGMKAPASQPAGDTSYRSQALEVEQGKYYYATGYGLCLLLQRGGRPWQPRLLRDGFDALLKSHTVGSVRQ